MFSWNHVTVDYTLWKQISCRDDVGLRGISPTWSGFLGRPNLTKVPMRRRILVTYTWASGTRVHKFARQHLKISRDRQNKNYDHRSVNQWGCYKRRTRTPTGTLFSWEAAVSKRTSVSLTLDTFCLSGRKWKSFIWRLVESERATVCSGGKDLKAKNRELKTNSVFGLVNKS